MIKSSFIKKSKVQQENQVFFGNPEFDALFNNNLKTGNIILMEQDQPSKLHLQFARQYIGSSYHLNQNFHVYDDGLNNWETLVPVKASKSNTEKKQQKSNDIAWRYDQMNLNPGSIQISSDIPQLDLQKSEEDQQQIKKLLNYQQYSKFNNLLQLFENICEQYQNSLKNPNDCSLNKFLLQNFLSQSQDLQYTQVQLAKFLHSLRVFAKSSFSMILISIPSTLDISIKNTLQRFADIAFKIKSDFGNKQYEDFQGLLQFSKLPNFQQLTQFKLETLIWGIKATSKRKIIIEKLYLSPELDSNQDQQQICSSKPGNNSKLEF